MTTQTKPQTSTWTIDKTHSNVDFQVKHLMISTVRGHFRDFDAALYIDEDEPENSRVTARVATASVDTNAEDRDAHLRSDDFFNSDDFPYMTFESTKVERLSTTDFRVTGDLTIRDVTKTVVLDGEYHGRIEDPWGNERASFEANTQISREEFGVRWNQAIETGGVVVSDRVKIHLYIEAVRSADTQE